MPSTQKCMSLFRKSIILLVPTETCKEDNVFTLCSDTIRKMISSDSMKPTQNIIADLIEQWTSLKRGMPQPLFDLIPMLSLSLLQENIIIDEIAITFCDNENMIGSPFEKYGMHLKSVRESVNKLVPGNIYATTITFIGNVHEMFQFEIEDIFNEGITEPICKKCRYDRELIFEELIFNKVSKVCKVIGFAVMVGVIAAVFHY
jgi:hypothetical protein